MKKIKITFGILLFISQFSFAQLPVTDVAANSNLILINTAITTLNGQIGTLLSTEATTKTTTVKNLTESLSQGEKMQKSLEDAKAVQDALKKVTSAIKSVKAVKDGVYFIYKTVKDTYFLIYQMNNMKYSSGKRLFKSKNIKIINDDIDTVLDQMNGILDVVKNLVRDDVFKMDDGKRLELIMSLNKDLEKHYNKVHRKVVIFKHDFGNYIVQPLKD